MTVLGIETSCDETAASVVKKGHILSNVISSSVPLHERFGGVIPEVASRFHIEYINKVTKDALRSARKTLKDISAVAVADRPGLPGSLLSGISYANTLSYALQKPLIRVDHLHAHIFANFLVKEKPKKEFPFIGVVVSGGHTNIFKCESFRDFTLLGRTKDDAIGEAFDKVAKVLGIGYPGGPKIERFANSFLAKTLAPINFPRAYLEKDSFDFSLSGIKTAVLYYVRKRRMTRREISRVSWSFQEAVFDVLVEKIVRACRTFKIDRVFLGGGVISNRRLRAKLEAVSARLGYIFHFPPPGLCVDNAAMIAGLGEVLIKRGG